MSTLIVGCGYLGQRVGAALLLRGERVHGTVRSPERALEIARLGIEPSIVDVLRPETMDAIPQVDRVLHCVGFDPSAGADMQAVYVQGLRNVLERLPSSVSRIVYASSTSVYGQVTGEWVDEDSPAKPLGESGRVCLEAEKTLAAWNEGVLASAVILRFSGLYGPGRVIRRAMLQRGEPVPGDPGRFLNLVHIDDAVQATVAALDAASPEGVYLVSDDRPVERREYYSLVARLLGALAAPIRACLIGARRVRSHSGQPSDLQLPDARIAGGEPYVPRYSVRSCGRAGTAAAGRPAPAATLASRGPALNSTAWTGDYSPLTSSRRAFFSGCLGPGMITSSTPLWNSAVALEGSAPSGNGRLR